MSRPDPDVLLERLQAEEARASRARLQVWLGFAPGVGKTFAMLQNARDLQEAGTDVVVGWVDTHGRYDTAALLLGLDIVPRRSVTHRGVELQELDVDAALARKPAVLIVDELAHDNAPGSRHPKRWQDVFELLDAGIEVHTTLNVQHIESLNDVVAQITGVRVRETVPDAVLDRADEIVVVDLQPDELLAALARRQGLPRRQRRTRGARLLPARQPARAARARVAARGRARRRRRAGVPSRTPDRGIVGGRRAHPGLRRRVARVGAA